MNDVQTTIKADAAVQAAHFAVCASVGRDNQCMSLYNLHSIAADACEAAAKVKAQPEWSRAQYVTLAAEMTEAANSFLARA